MKNSIKSMLFGFAFVLFSVLYTMNAAAVVASGTWSNGATSMNINAGDTATLTVDVFSMNPPITLNVGLYNAAGTLISSLYNSQISAKGFEQTFQVSPAVGSYTIIISASDAAGSIANDYKTLSLNVQAIVTPPTPPITDLVTLNHISDITALDGDNVEITAYATDLDNDAITYSIDDSDFTQSGSTFTWEDASTGNYTITITATDGNSSDSETFKLEVQKRSHKVEINTLTISKDEFNPGDSATINVEIKNNGNIDETNIACQASVSALGVIVSTGYFDLDQDDSISKSLQFTIPKTAKGTYTLVVMCGGDIAYKSFSVNAAVPQIDLKPSETAVATEGSNLGIWILIALFIILIISLVVAINLNRRV
jgi:hypothetical protein